MKRFDVRFDRVDGGQFDSIEPSSIPKSGWARQVNFLPYNSRINRRGGSTPFSLDTPPANFQPSACIPVRGLANAVGDLADWALVVASRGDGFALVNGNGSWQGLITQDVGGGIPDDEMPWCLKARGSRVYALRRNAGRMKRIEADGWTDAGRPAPTNAPTLDSITNAGSLVNGTFKVKYAFYDEDTGYVGNASPELSVLLDAPTETSFVIDTFDTPTSEVRATHYVFYMTRVDGGIFFQYGAPIPLATTSLTITAEPAGEMYTGRDDEPPTDATWMEFWNERAWWTNGTALNYSDFGKVESYSAVQGLEFDKNDGDEIVVIFAWGKYMVVAKRRKMMILTGYDRQSWQADIWTDEAGCVAPHSMRDCEGRLVWLGEDSFKAATPDGKPVSISNETVKAALAQMDRTKQDLVVAEVFPFANLYIAVYPKLDGTWGGVAFNYKENAWAELTFPAQPRYLTLGYNKDEQTKLFATTNGSAQVYYLLEGNTDQGAPIVCRVITAAPAFTEEAGDLLELRNVGLLTSATRYPITLRLYGDGDIATALSEVTVTLKDDIGWKSVNLNNRGNPKSQLQVELQYSGRDEFWLSQYSLVGVALKGRRSEF